MRRFPRAWQTLLHPQGALLCLGAGGLLTGMAFSAQAIDASAR